MKKIEEYSSSIEQPKILKETKIHGIQRFHCEFMGKFSLPLIVGCQNTPFCCKEFRSEHPAPYFYIYHFLQLAKWKNKINSVDDGKILSRWIGCNGELNASEIQCKQCSRDSGEL